MNRANTQANLCKIIYPFRFFEKSACTENRTRHTNIMIQPKLSLNLWKLGRLDHIAHATPNLKNTVNFYQNILGGKISPVISKFPHVGVKATTVELPNTNIEILSNMTVMDLEVEQQEKDSKPELPETSLIDDFLNENPNGGLHHICMVVDDMQAAIASVKDSNIRLMTDEPIAGKNGKLIIFLNAEDCGGVSVELKEQ